MLVIGIGAVLFSMAPSLGLFVLIPAPFVIVATLTYHRWMNPHFRRYWITRWRLNSMLNTFLSGIQVVKAFAQEDQEEAALPRPQPGRLDCPSARGSGLGQVFSR